MESDRSSTSSEEDSEETIAAFLTELNTMKELLSSRISLESTRTLDRNSIAIENRHSENDISLPIHLHTKTPPEGETESPQTDPDFDMSPSRSSSQHSSTSWISGTGMISSEMVDSMISGDGNGEGS